MSNAKHIRRTKLMQLLRTLENYPVRDGTHINISKQDHTLILKHIDGMLLDEGVHRVVSREE